MIHFCVLFLIVPHCHDARVAAVLDRNETNAGKGKGCLLAEKRAKGRREKG
jgi:hypothetical protein